MSARFSVPALRELQRPKRVGAWFLVFWIVGCDGGGSHDAGGQGPDGAARAAEIRACTEDFGSGLGLSDAAAPVSFRTDVMPFLVTHCNLAGCHLGDSSTGQLQLGEACTFDPKSQACTAAPGALTDAIAARVYANLTAPSNAAPNLKRVEPGRIDRSFLLMKLSGCQNAFETVTGCAQCGGEMPPNGKLRKYERASFDMLATWIRAGAPLD